MALPTKGGEINGSEDKEDEDRRKEVLKTHLPTGTLLQRIEALETAIWKPECAGPREAVWSVPTQLWMMVESETTKMAAAIDRLQGWCCEVAADVASLPALAAQVERIERALRRLASNNLTVANRDTLAILDGGDDA
jgi:hypothetical protein